MEPDSLLKNEIRLDLTKHVFVRQPWRALLVLPLAGAAVAGAVAIVAVPLPWYAALPVSLVIGNTYAGMMFLGHEIAHGATIRSGMLQNILLYICFGIFCLSPHHWRVWHNQVHHRNTNVDGRDPDNFGTIEEFHTSTPAIRFLVKFAPGSGHWLSAFYLFSFFTFQAANVLWRKSRTMPGFGKLRRRRAALDTGVMAACWVVLSISIGPRATVFVVVLPMMTANFVVMSYFVTNHMLRPLAPAKGTLGTTISVTTPRLVDRLHFHSSHHVEHHLFPTVCSSRLPLIRRSLRRHAGNEYVVVPHWWALRTVYRTPRVYDGAAGLIEPYSGRRMEIADVEAELRRYAPKPCRQSG